MNNKFAIFWSKGFIIGLLILLLNDHVLKHEFHNWFTGKLSDFAGLFIFPIFLAAFLLKFKKHIYWITAIGFIWWKSPLADSFIEFFNGLYIFNLSRVVDWTDLIALAVLPFSYYYLKSYSKPIFKLHPLPIIIVAAFGFIATSKASEKVECYKEYSFQYPIDTLKHKMFFHPNINNYLKPKWVEFDTMRTTGEQFSKYIDQKKSELENEFFMEPMWILINDSNQTCSGFSTRISVEKNRQVSKVVLHEFSNRFCKNTDNKLEVREILLKLFEEKIIRPLN